MKIAHVVGARPNFVKLAPVRASLAKLSGFIQYVVHTGQHYDLGMSEVFFRQLGIPAPDVNLEVGSGSHAQQTGQVMIRLEPFVSGLNPDLVLVYGDVNSTLAAALVCAKLGIPVGHVEAGLRSFDRTMPEEVNRILTDQLSDLLFTPSLDANENLKREGVEERKVHWVGNVMIDTLVRMLPQATALWKTSRLDAFKGSPYVLVTLHRPSNVDDRRMLKRIVQELVEIAQDVRVLFPVHPRTRQRIHELALLVHGVDLVEPLGYLEFLALETRAAAVVSDSGGIQEETTFLGIPCFTLRENTERPITVTQGTNCLVGRNLEQLRSVVHRVLGGQAKQGGTVPLWDGLASDRIATRVLRWWAEHDVARQTTQIVDSAGSGGHVSEGQPR